MKRGIRKKKHERLDDMTVARVIQLLEQEKPITKKAACETLNIAYSTSRLSKIIEEYKDKIEFAKKRFAANKGQPFSDLEIKEIVVSYLNGESISSIADSLYRSTYITKRQIEKLHLPQRTKNSSYQNPDMIPDEAVSELFEVGEIVWSARYNSVAEIIKRYLKYNNRLIDTSYSIWVFGKHNEFAYQPWWELGKLEVVKQYKIETEKFVKTEKPNFQYRVE